MEAKHVVAGLTMLSLLLAQAYLLPQRRGVVGGPTWLMAGAPAGTSARSANRRRAPAGAVIYDLRASSTLHAPGPATNR